MKTAKDIVVLTGAGQLGMAIARRMGQGKKILVADWKLENANDYTILRPDWFTNANEVDYELTRKGEPEKGQAISRKSIAAFIAEVIKTPEKYSCESLGIAKPGA